MQPFFKRFFPTEINQRNDKDYFNKQPHGNATFSKSRPQRKHCVRLQNFPGRHERS